MSDHDALPPSRDPGTAPRAPRSRTVLGALLALLVIAVLMALWFLLIDDGDERASVATVDASPTALPIPTPTPSPIPLVTNDVAPTTAPEPTEQPIPPGFEACGQDRAPLVTASYLVDTLSTPLNQRSGPSVDAELVGSFDPGQTGLTFNGECLVNLLDGYVWWQINNGTTDVWIASTFVTPR